MSALLLIRSTEQYIPILQRGLHQIPRPRSGHHVRLEAHLPILMRMGDTGLVMGNLVVRAGVASKV
jgi:hypothetical protein